MCVLKEVVGNVYFCDFEGADSAPARLTVVPVAVNSPIITDIRLMAVQINIALKEIIATQTALARQSDEQSRELFSMLNMIDSIVCEAAIPAMESPALGSREILELMQGAATLANSLLMLVRERALQASHTARRLEDFRRYSGLIEPTVA